MTSCRHVASTHACCPLRVLLAHPPSGGGGTGVQAITAWKLAQGQADLSSSQDPNSLQHSPPGYSGARPVDRASQARAWDAAINLSRDAAAGHARAARWGSTRALSRRSSMEGGITPAAPLLPPVMTRACRRLAELEHSAAVHTPARVAQGADAATRSHERHPAPATAALRQRRGS